MDFFLILGFSIWMRENGANKIVDICGAFRNVRSLDVKFFFENLEIFENFFKLPVIHSRF